MKRLESPREVEEPLLPKHPHVVENGQERVERRPIASIRLKKGRHEFRDLGLNVRQREQHVVDTKPTCPPYPPVLGKARLDASARRTWRRPRRSGGELK